MTVSNDLIIKSLILDFRSMSDYQRLDNQVEKLTNTPQKSLIVTLDPHTAAKSSGLRRKTYSKGV